MSGTFPVSPEIPNRPEVKFRPRHFKVKRPQVPVTPSGELTRANNVATAANKPCRPVSRDWSAYDENRHLEELRNVRKVLSDEGTVLWLKQLRRAVKSGDQAALLCQMLYWFDRGRDGKTRARLRIKGGEELWMAKTVEEFGEEVGLSARQSRSALAALVNLGLIEKRAGGFSGRKTTFWRIVPEAIARVLKRN